MLYQRHPKLIGGNSFGIILKPMMKVLFDNIILKGGGLRRCRIALCMQLKYFFISVQLTLNLIWLSSFTKFPRFFIIVIIFNWLFLILVGK